MKIYIEELTLWNLFQVFCSILKQIKAEESNQKIIISYIDGTFGGLALLRGIGIFWGWKISQLTFDLMNVREGINNDLTHMIIFNHHLWNIKEKLQQEYPEIFNESHNNNLGMFLIKNALFPGIPQPGSLSRAIYINRVIASDMKLKGIDNSFLFMLDHEWKKPIQVFAKTIGIQIIYLKHFSAIVRPSTDKFTIKFSALLKNYVEELVLTMAPQLALWAKQIIGKLRMLPTVSGEKSLKAEINKIAVFGKGELICYPIH